MPLRVIDLEAEGREALKGALTGPSGYGVPKYCEGYPLVGHSVNHLQELFEINTHPDAKNGWPLFPDLEPRDPLLGLPIGEMSPDFWDRFFPRFFNAVEKEGLGWYHINTWHPKKGLKIEVYLTDEGEWFHIPMSSLGDFYGLMIRTNKVRVKTGSVRAEKQARKNLLAHLNRQQRKELILTGCFVEKGKSGIYYRIRFNRPKVAFRETKGKGGLRYETFISSLCLHPLGYYYKTYAGCMAPSDEMLAHLLLIRSDEIGFWRDANQHGIDDPLGGLA